MFIQLHRAPGVSLNLQRMPTCAKYARNHRHTAIVPWVYSRPPALLPENYPEDVSFPSREKQVSFDLRLLLPAPPPEKSKFPFPFFITHRFFAGCYMLNEMLNETNVHASAHTFLPAVRSQDQYLPFEETLMQCCLVTLIYKVFTATYSPPTSAPPAPALAPHAHEKKNAELPSGPSQPRRRVLLGRLPVQLLHIAAHQGQEAEGEAAGGRQET